MGDEQSDPDYTPRNAGRIAAIGLDISLPAQEGAKLADKLRVEVVHT